MASKVTKHASGNWCFYFYDSKKSPKSKWFYFDPDKFTKKQVRDIRDQRANLYEKGEWNPWADQIQESSITINNAKKEYLKHAKKELAGSTLQTADSYLSIFCEKFGKRKAGMTSVKELSDFINSYENYNTRRTVHYVIQRFYNWLSDKGYTDSIHIEMLSTRQEKKERTKYPITEAQLFELIEGFKVVRDRYLKSKHVRRKDINQVWQRHIEMTRVLFYMGLRMSDVLHLRPAWIIDKQLLRIGDLKQWNLKDEYHPKSMKETDPPIAIPSEVQGLILNRASRYGKFERIFEITYAKRYQEPFKLAAIEAFGKDFAKRFTPHSLRHSCATYWLNERNVPVQEVQRLMRHEDIKTTMGYYHPSTEAHLTAFQGKN